MQIQVLEQGRWVPACAGMTAKGGFSMVLLGNDFWEMKARCIGAYAVGSAGACYASTTEDASTHA